jgi:hypothetical protein
LAESHKLNPWPLDEGPRPKSGKSTKKTPCTIFVVKKIVFKQKKKKKKKKLKKRTHDLKDQDAKARVQIKGFNLLKMGPNWFLGIWLDLGTPSKVGLRQVPVELS